MPATWQAGATSVTYQMEKIPRKQAHQDVEHRPLGLVPRNARSVRQHVVGYGVHGELEVQTGPRRDAASAFKFAMTPTRTHSHRRCTVYRIRYTVDANAYSIRMYFLWMTANTSSTVTAADEPVAT